MITSKLPDYFLIDPYLQEDAFERKGQIGLLVYGYEDDDLYFLRFEDKEIYSYSAVDMLTLKKKEDILNYLETNGREIAKSDFRALYNITLFLDYGTFDGQKKALELAKTNDVILNASLSPLNETLNQSRDSHVGR